MQRGNMNSKAQRTILEAAQKIHVRMHMRCIVRLAFPAIVAIAGTVSSRIMMARPYPRRAMHRSLDGKVLTHGMMCPRICLSI